MEVNLVPVKFAVKRKHLRSLKPVIPSTVHLLLQKLQLVPAQEQKLENVLSAVQLYKQLLFLKQAHIPGTHGQ